MGRALALRYPDIGDTVGEYTLVDFLGSGGGGIVFKAERGGRFFAVKFLGVSQLDAQARREIALLNLLENPGVVRYVGSDYWPDTATGCPYIVMEYVPGDTLEAFARHHNPSARKVVHLLL